MKNSSNNDKNIVSNKYQEAWLKTTVTMFDQLAFSLYNKTWIFSATEILNELILISKEKLLKSLLFKKCLKYFKQWYIR